LNLSTGAWAASVSHTGAQIIDMMILVVDVTKGIQTQTAECLVVGEILTQQLIVVLNKTDMLPADTRADKVRQPGRTRGVLPS
jgi:selenocysteine-specific translation elongation factor